MTTTFQKDPAATLDYSVDWTEFLEDEEVIAASQWTVPSGITQVTTSYTDKKATIWLSGGTLGQTYELVNRITTDNNPARIDERTIVILMVNK